MSTETPDEVTQKAIDKTKGQDFNSIASYVSSAGFQVLTFFIYLLLLSAPIVYWTKIAKSGILFNLKSNGELYCSPFINSGSEITETNHKIGEDGNLIEHNIEFIKTDQISFFSNPVSYETWGKIIMFDYKKNIIDRLATKDTWKKFLFGFNVEEDITQNVIYKNPALNFIHTTKWFGSYFKLVRFLTWFNIGVLRNVFLYLSIIPETLLFILPAIIPSLFIFIFYALFNIILLINAIFTFVFLVYQILSYFLFYIIRVTYLFKDWTMGNMAAFIALVAIIFLLSFLLIFFLFYLILFLFSIAYTIYGFFILLVVCFNPIILLFYIGWNFTADVYEKNEEGKFIKKDEEYSCRNLLISSMVYKKNWIIFTIALILILNIGTHFDVSGLNIILIILLLIGLVFVLRNKLVGEDVDTSTFMSFYKYKPSDLIKNGLTDLSPISQYFQFDYSSHYKCNNETIANEQYYNVTDKQEVDRNGNPI